MADMERVVRTQAELDAAIEDGVGLVSIDSHRGEWLMLRDNGESLIVVDKSSKVHLFGTCTIYAHAQARVYAHDSTTVFAFNESTVYSFDSATVYEHDSATVRAHDSATVIREQS